MSESYKFNYITVPVVTTTTTTGGGTGGTTVTTITTAKHSSKDATYTISSNYGDYTKGDEGKILSNLDKSLTEGDYHVFLTWNSKTNEQMFGNQKLNVYYKDGSYASSTSASDGVLIDTLKEVIQLQKIILIIIHFTLMFHLVRHIILDLQEKVMRILFGVTIMHK